LIGFGSIVDDDECAEREGAEGFSCIFFIELSGISEVDCSKHFLDVHSSQRKRLDGFCVLQEGVLHCSLMFGSTEMGSFLTLLFGFVFSA
jgi:hypothetical protein